MKQRFIRSGMTRLNVLAIVAGALTLVGSTTKTVLRQKEVGKGPSNGCQLSAGTDPCPGLWVGDQTTPGFVTFIRNAQTLPKNPVTVLRYVDPTTTRATTIQTTIGSALAAFRNLSTDRLVIGRINTDPNGGDDPMYKIGRTKTANWDTSFFVVLDSIKISFFEAALSVVGGSSVSLGNYSIYGINSAGQLSRVMQGKLKWCTHSHKRPLSGDSASFAGCKAAAKWQLYDANIRSDSRLNLPEYSTLKSALQDRSIHDLLRAAASSGHNVVEQQLKVTATVKALFSTKEAKEIDQMLLEDLTAPAWITCGTGCCTLESDS